MGTKKNLTQEEENEWYDQFDNIIKNTNDIMFQTQNKILIQKEEDESFWVDHIHENMEKHHMEIESLWEAYYFTPDKLKYVNNNKHMLHFWTILQISLLQNTKPVLSCSI